MTACFMYYYWAYKYTYFSMSVLSSCSDNVDLYAESQPARLLILLSLFGSQLSLCGSPGNVRMARPAGLNQYRASRCSIGRESREKLPL